MTAVEDQLHGWLAEAITKRETSSAVRTLRKLVAGRPTGDAIGRRSES